MSDDLNTEIKIGADASGVETGVGKAKRSLASLGETAKKAGQDAGAGMASVGAGGDKAAKDVERATKNIQGQLQRAIAAFDAGEKGSRKFYESIARQRGVDVNTLKPLLDQLDAYKSKTEAASQASAKVGTSFTGLSAAAGLAARAVAAIGIGASVGEFVKMADASTNVASRLGLVTSSAAELASVQARLFGIAQSSRVSFTDLVGTYAQVARSTKDLGVSQTALLGVIQTISQAVTISGGSAASAQAALVQLSQGFASGALRGEELNSVMEQTPRLAQAIAEGLGVSIGQLREMGKAGELTSEKVLGALEKSAASVAAEFGKMAVTVEQASTNAANSALKLVGALDKITGASSATAGGISRLSAGMDSLTLNIERLASSKGLGDFFFLAFNNERSLNGELAITQKELASLEARLARAPSNIYTRSAVADLREYVKELKEAQARLAALSGQAGPADPRDQSGFTGRGASYANEAARQAKLREDANAFRLNQSGVPASYLKDMAELIRLNQAGVLVGKEYTDALAKQQDLLLKKTTTVRGSAAAANAEQNAYESLISSIRAKIEADNLEIAGGAALTESQRIRIKLDQDLAAGRVKLSAKNERAVRLALEELSASEASALAAKTLAKANLDAAASRDKYLTSLSSGLDKIQADIAAQEEATARMGLSKEAIAELDAAKLEMLATDLELQAIKAMDRNLDQQTYDALKKQAAAYRELGIAKKGGAAKEAARDMEKANAEAAKKAQEDWERAAEQINSSLTEALMRGFESGKDFAKNLRDTVVNMFKTMVLRPVISAIVNPIAGAVTGALGFSGAANAATGGGGIMGMASNASSAYNLVSGGGAFAGALGSGFTMGMGGLGSMGVALEGGAAMLGSATGVSSALAGIGQIAGALGPIALGIGAIAGLASLFGSKSTQEYGAVANYSAASGLQTAKGGYENNAEWRNFGTGFGGVAYEQGIATQVSSITQSIVMALDATAKTFGQTVGYEAAAGFASDFGEEATWGGLRIALQGTDLVNWNDNRESKWAPREFDSGEEGYKQYLAEIAQDTRQVLLDMDLPSWADEIITSIGEAASMDQLSAALQQIGVIQTTFVQLGKTMEGFAGLTDKAFEALMKASGGFEALSANAGTYYENFYSEAEKTAAVTRSVSDALAQVGLAMPATRDEFRALVESQLSLGESGAQAVAALLGVSGAFASVVPAAEVAGQAIGDVLSEAMKRLQSDTAGLQIELLRAQGDTPGADAAQRAIDTSGMSAAEVAIYDYNTALRAQITSLADATAAAQEQGNIRAGFERQLLELTGDTAALRLLDIAGMDAANVALYDRVQALQAEQAAAEQAQAQAQREADAFVSLYGDVAAALAEINPPTKTLVEQWRSNSAELADITKSLADALGELPAPTAIDSLKASLATLSSAMSGIANISDMIFGLQVGKGDQSSVDTLQKRESELWSSLSTSADPGAVSAQLARTMLDRIKLQGQLSDKAANEALKGQFDAATAIAQLDKDNRDAQIAAIKEQISGAQTLLDVASSMKGYLAELRFGDLSALNPSDQLNAAQANYASLLGAAQGGDAKAAQELQGGASSYLKEAQGYYGGATSQYAGIFGSVTGELDQFGATPVTDLTLLQEQLTALENITAASLELQTVVTDTTDLQIHGLENINLALGRREEEARTEAADNKKAVQEQIVALNAIVENQAAQIRQQAAVYEGLMQRLDAATKSLESLDNTSKQTAAAPA